MRSSSCGRHWECFKEAVPHEFALNHLVGSFAETVKWWIGNRMKLSPEEVTEYYLVMIGCDI